MAVDLRSLDTSPFAAIDRIYERQQRNRARVAAEPAAARIRKIRALREALLAHRADIHEALRADYRKPAAEVDLSEVYPLVSEARHAERHLKRWTKPRRVATPLALIGSRSYIQYEPKGVVLVIAPWNFPILLTLGPVISAIAAGNCAMVKPSEMTPHASACMKRILSEVFDESEVAIVEGDASVAESLLRKRFDHIFFTGSPAVGKIVMKAAAEHLTSVTLELGGKSPVIIDRTADVEEAAKKVAWGKFLNCGQICIAPDYALVDETVRDRFLDALRAAVQTGVSGQMVNDRHAHRVKRLLDDAVERGATIVTGGTANGRDIAPTVLAGVSPDALIMRDEIFGPLLPVMTYRTREEAVRIINEREKPLVMYVFSRDRSVVRRLLRETSAGGTVINDTLVHFFQLNLPFGGVGNSGMGKSHGFFGFEAFSNARGVMEQPTRLSTIQLIYPPYTPLKKKIIEFLLRWL